MNFQPLFSSIAQLKVGIVGDAMLDAYWWGQVNRISPEAPVPIVALQNKDYRIGGAGNVALNTVALGAQTHLFTVLGNDADGNILLQMLAASGVHTAGCLQSPDRITTTKTRIMSRNQQMMRLDAEITKPISHTDEQALLQTIQQAILNKQIDVLIFEDYNKGVLTPHLIASLIGFCQQHGVITTVDPKKDNFLAYKGVDMFKPNLKEVKEGLNITIDSVTSLALQQAHEALHRHLQHHISFITLSEYGVYYGHQHTHQIIPCHRRNIADVSGAGDTVIAVASLVYTATKNMHLAAEMANIAGGLVCEQVGTAAIDARQLLMECTTLLSKA